MQTPRQVKRKLHLLSGICFVLVAGLLASEAFGHRPASAPGWVGACLFVVAGAFQIAAFFRQRHV